MSTFPTQTHLCHVVYSIISIMWDPVMYWQDTFKRVWIVIGYASINQSLRSEMSGRGREIDYYYTVVDSVSGFFGWIEVFRRKNWRIEDAVIPKKWALSSLLERSKKEKRPNFDVTRDVTISDFPTIVFFISKYLPRPTRNRISRSNYNCSLIIE